MQMCSLFSAPMITTDDIEKAASLATKFGEAFEALYGGHKVTPNMHLHTHIADCILDYGPVYSFWLYSFERYNGILGSYTTNQKSIEIQVMRKFLNDMQVKTMATSLALSDEYKDIFSSFFVGEQGCRSTKFVMDCF